MLLAAAICVRIIQAQDMAAPKPIRLCIRMEQSRWHKWGRSTQEAQDFKYEHKHWSAIMAAAECSIIKLHTGSHQWQDSLHPGPILLSVGLFGSRRGSVFRYSRYSMGSFAPHNAVVGLGGKQSPSKFSYFGFVLVSVRFSISFGIGSVRLSIMLICR